MKILVADDDLVMRALISAYLHSILPKSIIHTAHDGAFAIHLWNKYKDYNLVITDYEMDNLNGDEVAKLIHSEDKNIPIICLTGRKDICTEEYPFFDMILEKPITKKQFRSEIMKILINYENVNPTKR